MTVYVVCVFRGGPVAAFRSMPAAHRYVLAQPGKYNAYEVQELVLDEED